QDHWKPNAFFAKKCEELAFWDPDSGVRGIALISLGPCYANTKDSHISQRLATIVRDESINQLHRESAYCNLFMIQGAPFERNPLIQKAIGKFRFPDDVDWSFVDSFLEGA